MLAKNTIANYLGQGYTSVISIVVLPMYLDYISPEEFGLIGFFTLLSTWLQILTVGLNPTLSRQVAVFRSEGLLASHEFRVILRSLEVMILVLGLLTAVSVLTASNWIAQHWLNAKDLNQKTIINAVSMMGIISALRWGISLYSSGLAGMEQQVWLNVYNVVIATARNIGGLVWIGLVSRDIEAYFLYQVALSIIELFIVGFIFYRNQPKIENHNDPGLKFSLKSIRSLIPFTLATSYTALLWVFVSQFDKVILSKILPLEVFGYLSFVMILSNGVLRIADPINQAVLPRLTAYATRHDENSVRNLYKKTTQFLSVASLSTSGVIAAFPSQTLFLLSNNPALTNYGSPILVWFSLGNGVLAIASLLYTLQVAQGQLRLHVQNSTIGALIQVPLLAYIALHYDVVTLGITWFALRLVMFAVLSPIVHVRFNQGSYSFWILRDIGLPLMGATLGIALSVMADTFIINSGKISQRGALLFILITYGLITIFCSAAFAPHLRTTILSLHRKIFRSQHKN